VVGKPHLEEFENVLLELVRSAAVAFDAAEVAHAGVLAP
jgi:hypothetical protein